MRHKTKASSSFYDYFLVVLGGIGLAPKILSFSINPVAYCKELTADLPQNLPHIGYIWVYLGIFEW